jgi:hypothetical protein
MALLPGSHHSSSSTTLSVENMTPAEVDGIGAMKETDPDSGDVEAAPAPKDENDNNNNTVPVVSPAPDGGLVAWLQVAGAFLLFFNSW